MDPRKTLDERREQLIAQAMQTENVSAGMQAFAAAIQYAPQPQLVPTSQTRFSISTNR